MSTRVQPKTSPSLEGLIATIHDVTSSRISVSLEADLARRVRDIAAQRGLSVSAWIAEAVRHGVRNVGLGEVIDEIIAANGWNRDELIAEAQRSHYEQRFASEKPTRQAALSDYLDAVLAENSWDREELVAEAVQARVARRSA